MTEPGLREALRVIAEDAPDLRLDGGELYRRGRRATATARVIGGVVAVACVVLVMAVGWQTLRPAEAPVADGDAPSSAGVPDQIFTPPDIPEERDRSDDIPDTAADLPAFTGTTSASGPVVASYLVGATPRRLVVVTGDGGYHRLQLRRMGSFDDAFRNGPLLSPDGTALAFGKRRGDGAGMRLGIGLLDLASLETRWVDLDGRGSLIRSLQWSPSGDWLVWSGQELESARRDSASYGALTAGVVDVATGTSTALRNPKSWDGAGVCDDGRALRTVSPVHLVSTDGDRAERHRLLSDVVAAHGPCSLAAGAGSVSVDDPVVLGWLPDPDGTEPTAVLAQPRLEDDGSWDTDDIVLTPVAADARRTAEDDGAPTVVGSARSVGYEWLTVATGLMSREDPTVPAGPDPWAEPWWTDAWPWFAIGAGALMLTLLVVRRYRASSRRVSASAGRDRGGSDQPG